jgi:zinc transporter 9
LEKILQEVQSFESAADLENFLLTHGEQIVDCVGAELDRIEKLLKAKHPNIRHLDLEVL